MILSAAHIDDAARQNECVDPSYRFKMTSQTNSLATLVNNRACLSSTSTSTQNNLYEFRTSTRTSAAASRDCPRRRCSSRPVPRTNTNMRLLAPPGGREGVRYDSSMYICAVTGRASYEYNFIALGAWD
eukprot:scaffold667958_cov81-Prasinocladus_malaysianus.AAC.1